MDLLRHGARPGLFGQIRAHVDAGVVPASFTWGNVRQLEQKLLAALAAVLHYCPARHPGIPGRRFDAAAGLRA
jgi:hypothetical protein